jgi:hypothetical protein
MQTVIEFAKFFQFKKIQKIAADFWLHIYPKTFNTRRIDDFGTKDKSYISRRS